MRKSRITGAINARQAPQTAFTGAARYSRFVLLMKLLLPLTAFSVIALTVFFSATYEVNDELTVTFAKSPSLKDDRRMIAPTFSGTNQDGNPFKVTAASAERLETDRRIILLNTLSATIGTADGGTLNLSSTDGELDTARQVMTLSGDVKIEAEAGYTFTTAVVSINLDEESVRGETPVTGAGPMGTLKAGSFTVSPGWGTVRFHDGVRVDVEPGHLTPGRDAKPSARADTAAGNR
ncbi:MAG: LPS export ABC transporter periplasmic protein LptC [Alphaproteobacteria bacterium]